MNKTFNISVRQAAHLSMIILLSFMACRKDESIQLFVDSSLQEYFDRFAVEGAQRNVAVDYEAERISGFIRLITSPNVIGQCAHDPNEPGTVIIDRTYWNSATDLQREFLVFHELGHCVLDRDHLDEADAQGNCISMMASGSGQCKINYNQGTREKLLDELFMN